jgi:formamidopyrimidine-DNA glycosylase
VPELPEVETLRQSLARHLPGRRIIGISVRQPRLRERVNAARLRRLIVGRKVCGLRRRAKYLLVDLVDDSVLIVHLGMSGRLSLSTPRAPLHPHDHIRFRLDDGRELRFRDPRRFGLIDALTAAQAQTDARLARAGREPLDPTLRADWLWRSSRGVKRAIKTWLMDGGVVAGLGNIYANEALFRAGIKPQLEAGKLSLPRCTKLVEEIRATLAEAITQGGSTLRDFVNTAGQPGYFQQHYWVYGRSGEPCRRCGAPITQIKQGQRSSFYCRHCQK